MHLQDRFKDPIGLFHGDLGGGDNSDFSFDRLINDKVFAGQLADELDKEGNIHIVKINGDITIIRLQISWGLLGLRCGPFLNGLLFGWDGPWLSAGSWRGLHRGRLTSSWPGLGRCGSYALFPSHTGCL